MTWQLPAWFTTNSARIQHDLAPHCTTMLTYQLWHDCGKPFCRTLDDAAKPHYPGHAELSAELYLACGGDPTVAELISADMLCHTLRPSEAALLAQNPHALKLLCTALCELHANASMFGGLESDSFKIKFKRLEKLGKNVLNLIKE